MIPSRALVHLVGSFQALSGQCGFMAANLYARSIFGEDALANLSIELPVRARAPVAGHVRIRAKTQVTLSRIVFIDDADEFIVFRADLILSVALKVRISS